MANFVELQDGTLLNLDHVVRLQPNSRSNRLEFVTGAHLQLIEADAEKVRQASLANRPMLVNLNNLSDMQRTFIQGFLGNLDSDANDKEEEKQRIFDEAVEVIDKKMAEGVKFASELNGASLSTEEKPRKRRGRPPKNKA